MVVAAAAASGDGASTSSTALAVAAHDRTRRMFDRVAAAAAAAGKQQQQQQAGGAGGRTSYDALLAADDAWLRLRTMPTGRDAGPAPEFVLARPRGAALAAGAAGAAAAPAFDVAVAGGTLGVFVAAALAMRGLRVAVVERGPLAGRQQEWNISRAELGELVEAGVLTHAEAEACIAIEFNPVRVGFHGGGGDVWTTDVLNLGVRPDALVATMRRKLEQCGGKVYERVGLRGVEVMPDGVVLSLATAAPDGSGSSSGSSSGGSGEAPVQYGSSVRARLLLDCTGHAGPIVRQLRWGQKPDGVCLVVGGCARGFDPERNTTADIIYTTSDAEAITVPDESGGGSTRQEVQFFWEAFPAAAGMLPGSAGTKAGAWRSDAKTTYMFTYLDAQPWRPSLRALFDEYWRLMPGYQRLREQGVDDVERLHFERLLFGTFPTFKDAPLKPGFDRVLQIGDASGVQSPLSFGGFGALTRHLRRLVGAVADALEADALSAGELALINSYNPGLSSAWMLQRAMTAARSPDGRGAAPPGLINKMLADNFSAMQGLGEPTLKPFLQDVIKFRPLLSTMAKQLTSDPLFVPQLTAHVGPLALADWTGHVAALGAFAAADAVAAPPLRALAASGALPPKAAYTLRRTLEAWRYGAGADYERPTNK